MICSICRQDILFDLETPALRCAHLQPNFNMYRCPQCGVYFQHPMPSPETLSAMYAAGEPEDVVHRLPVTSQIRNDNLAPHPDAKMIEEICKSRSLGNGKYVEIGCGSGHLTWSVYRSGCFAKVTGYEPCQTLVDSCNVKYIKCADDTILWDLPENHYNMVAMRHVIEHCTDPRKVLKHAYRVLAPGGVLFLITPNYDTVEIEKRGAAWEWVCPQHLWGFTARALESMWPGAMTFQTKKGDAREASGDQELIAIGEKE